MSQKIYLDDCANDGTLVRQLEAAGHHVTTPVQADIRGQDDEVHFKYAQAHGLILITKNPDDFEALHDADTVHPGILLIYQDNDPDRDMTPADIVRAIANLESAGVGFAGACYSLNAWRY